MRKYKKSNESVGILKEIDNLGRMVIPKDMRNLLKLESSVEVIMTEKGILLRNPEYTLVKITRKRKISSSRRNQP